jgi:ribosomal protein S18 acetylase RimI-like enzyme
MKQVYSVRDGLGSCFVEETAPGLFYISHVNVHRLWQAQGLGRDLMNAVIADAEREEATLFLEAASDAIGALSAKSLAAWYGRLGFRRTFDYQARGLPVFERFPTSAGHFVI